MFGSAMHRERIMSLTPPRVMTVLAQTLLKSFRRPRRKKNTALQARTVVIQCGPSWVTTELTLLMRYNPRNHVQTA